MTPDNATQAEARARLSFQCDEAEKDHCGSSFVEVNVVDLRIALAYVKEATPSVSVERVMALIEQAAEIAEGYIRYEASDFPVCRSIAYDIRALTLPVEPEAKGEGMREAGVSFVIGEARKTLALVQGCMECNADDERRWMETIQWLERLA